MISFLKRRWWILLSIAVVLGLCRLRFDVDVLDLLPPGEPTVQGLKLYQRHFTNARELILTVSASDSDQADKVVTTLAARLRQHTNLIESVTSQEPWTEHPEELGELLACMWLNQPPDSVVALTNRFTPDQLKAMLAQTRQLLATSFSMQDWLRQYDPFDLMNMPALTNIAGISLNQNQSMFASPDGMFRVLYVQSAVDLDSYRSCETWLAAIHDVVNGLRSEGPASDWTGVAVRYTGRPVFVQEIASSMQKDMSHSVGITATIIALLFWLTHRRWKPMFWLLALLGLILFVTLALGGLILGTISVISLGFAAVLLGLAVDYAVVHYQEALAHPDLSVPEIRRAIAPSILWAAITTMSAFLVLNLGGLPGLGQLGSLVAIGVAVSALVMVMVYLPPLFPDRRNTPPTLKPVKWWNYFVAPIESPATHTASRQKPNPFAFAITIFILIAACGVLCFIRPRLDRSGDALRPMHSEAEAALDELTGKMMELHAQPLWVIVSGESESQVYQRLTDAESLLDAGVSNHVIDKFVLPTALWPRPVYQAANKTAAAFLGRQGTLLHSVAAEEGFNSNALILTDELLRTWANAATTPGVVWPTNNLSQWLLKRFVAKTPGQLYVMGLVYPATNHVDIAALAGLSAQLNQKGALLSSWELLGAATLKRVESRLWQIVAPMIILVLASLWSAFRRATEILLGGAVLCLGGLVLLAIMAIFGWSWNLMNLMALPLILGTGVDYCIFMQLALRRHGGDLLLARRSVGRALLLCGGAAMAAFGSLAFSSNAGMASLGRVCAVGIGANMLISVFLLPYWWTRATGNGSASTHSKTPSALYRTGLWRLGLRVVKLLPPGLVKSFSVGVSEIYFLFARRRREIIVQNFLPVFGNDRRQAEAAAHRLHRRFAEKLVDLWRVENGVPVQNWIVNQPELEIIRAARARGRGTLFITLHLGNWEHGGLLLNQLGIRLTVLTLAEPDDGLTEIRKASRARCGVDTLVIGGGSFAFVEVIKQLQAGADLAISLDRPPDQGGVPIEFFGHPFEASLAAAELARASGCALIGVTIVRRPEGYAVKVLPEFTYDRAALGKREARRDLTWQILRAFEPEIRENIDQWYQFVPIWPQGG